MIIKLPDDVKFIISKLPEAYAVGGCIRDSLLGLNPKDWDICTSAKPDDVIKAFEDYHVIETGLKHGTVTIMINHVAYEVTTFRVNGEYTDGNRPESVDFVANLKEDLARRDFTINAMAYNDKVGLVDYFGGQENLKNGTIHCVGSPNDRFSEDALRIVRALRFAAVYGFQISIDTQSSIKKLYPLLKNISVERFSYELCEILQGKAVVDVLERFWYVFNEFIPEIEPMVGFEQHNDYHIFDVWVHTITAIANSEKDLSVRLALLFHDTGKPECFTMDEKCGHFYGHSVVSERICRNRLTTLKFSNNTINQISELVLYHEIEVKISEKAIKKLLNKIDEANFRKLLDVKRADIMGHSLKSRYMLEHLDHIGTKLDKIIADNQCFKLKNLAITGKDLIKMGIPQGKEIGYILSDLLTKVIDGDIENDREVLIACVKGIST